MIHPLVQAIELRDRAIRKKAHPKIVNNLDRRVKEEATKSLKILKAGFPEVIDSLLNSTPLKLS